MKELDINGYKETIIERSDYPIELCKQILNNETTAILGYGPQGRGQGLNMRDQGFDVILGIRKGISWEKALEDGWVEGENLYSIQEAALKSGQDRFRPIFLTSITTFVSLIPLLLEKSLQAQFLIPMAISLGFGVLFSTFITLILVPNGVIIVDNFREKYFN